MANRERGEVEVLLDGRPYTWRLTINAACTLEARTGQKLGALLEAVDEMSMLAFRDLVWVCLQECHGAEFPTVDSAGEFLDRVGLPRAVAAFRDVIEVNRPRAADPPAPRRGTGASSASRPAA